MKIETKSLNLNNWQMISKQFSIEIFISWSKIKKQSYFFNGNREKMAIA